ncbi:MAG: GNAT family N-acetyltransferase [Lysobacteraceae bacterium]|nr:MAG: GNAT family N-acetyltransferase [Xanthomonadaceae bacterium]
MTSVPLHVRPAGAADLDFFAELYRSPRPDLLALLADPRYIDAIVAMQQAAQVAGYRGSYPDAQYLVLELDGVAAGRLVTAAAAAGGAVRVVDIAVIPWARRRGVAGEALRRVQAQAALEGQDVTLAVRKDNAGAVRLYAALGFAVEEEDAVKAQLRWCPS